MGTRRSFLAAIMGAVTAPVVAKTLPGPLASLLDFPRPVNSPGDLWRHWCITESVLIIPDTTIDDTIFPAPSPEEFKVRRIALTFDPDNKADDVSRVLHSCTIEMKAGGRHWLRGPVWAYEGNCHGMPFMPELPGARDFSVRLFSDGPVPSSETVRLYIAMMGVVKVGAVV